MTILKLLENMAPFSRQQGTLDVADNVAIPYTLLKGKSCKPLVTISAAVHGCEYVGVKTVLNLSQQWDFKEEGSVLLLHTVNPTGFLSKTTTLVPEDQLNLNRIFQDTSNHDSLSYHIKKTICSKVLACSDYLIDLHGGNKEEILTPHGYYSTLAKEDVAQESFNMLRASGTPIIYASKATGGVYQAGALDYRIPSILLEQGDLGRCLPDDVQTMTQAVLNVVAYIFHKNLPPHTVEPRIFTKWYECVSAHDGCWTCNVLPNQDVKKGDVLGEITDIFGNVLENIVAQEDGLVLFQKATLVTKKDDVLVTIISRGESDKSD